MKRNEHDDGVWSYGSEQRVQKPQVDERSHQDAKLWIVRDGREIPLVQDKRVGFPHKLAVLIITCALTVPAFAKGSGFSLDVPLLGQGRESDFLVGAGLAYDLDGRTALVGRVVRREASDGHDWIGQVGFERRVGTANRWNPYVGGGAGVVKEWRDRVVTITGASGPYAAGHGPDWTPPPPVRVEHDPSHDYITIHAGGGFAYHAGGRLSWVGDARLVPPLNGGRGGPEIQAVAGARFNL